MDKRIKGAFCSAIISLNVGLSVMGAGLGIIFNNNAKQYQQRGLWSNNRLLEISQVLKTSDAYLKHYEESRDSLLNMVEYGLITRGEYAEKMSKIASSAYAIENAKSFTNDANLLSQIETLTYSKAYCQAQSENNKNSSLAWFACVPVCTAATTGIALANVTADTKAKQKEVFGEN